MAVATNNTLIDGNNESLSTAQPIEIVQSDIKIDSNEVVELEERIGIKPKQDIEEEFKLADSGFTNIKSKKRQRLKPPQKQQESQGQTKQAESNTADSEERKSVVKRRSPRISAKKESVKVTEEASNITYFKKTRR